MAKRSLDPEIGTALRGNLPALAMAALFSGGINLLYLASPLYLTQVYNRVLSSQSVPTLVALTLVLAFALAVMGMLDAIRARVLGRVGAMLDTRLAHRVLAASVGRAVRPGEARSAQALRDLDQVRMTIASPAVHFLFDAPWTPLYFVLLFLVHPALGTTAALGTLVLLAVAVLNEWATRRRLSRATDTAARAYAFTESLVRHAEVIRAMGMQAAVARRWDADRDGMLGDQARAGDLNTTSTAAIRFLRLLLQAAMLGVGAYLAIDHTILPATIFAASIIMARALAPVEQAVASWRQFVGGADALRRLDGLLRAEPTPRARMHVPIAAGGLTVEGLSYLLPGTRRPLLRNVSFDLPPGELLGVVGPSGAGKSTLAKLVVGALPPSSGRVRFGGVDLDPWGRADHGRAIGYLPQEAGLFPGTIRDNIARFHADADDAAIVAATELAGVHAMILDLPDGYETVLGEGGAGLSGGQRQRVGLARALFGDPRLVVLDEPNANLDAAGEMALIQAIVEVVSRGANVLVVAHRPNLIAAADRILVVEGGAISAYGPRAELIDSLRRRQPRSVEARA
ncbi:type I secretion system permease/ATPase [Methylobacterium sp. NEAU 140]|uniref:type I secretion system permease/ATPase n=1 Tax=Methylobacterium sp. NEAU 140 TaxID=3064945 RepID=UPI00273636B0|nr:type I secretion system permease/ATPase [Methylobacterium sp. NEAU 140]MDP4027116.1 type I secretion system permease/ATPase [Methylobacterium sp. NEAU 140]